MMLWSQMSAGYFDKSTVEASLLDEKVTSGRKLFSTTSTLLNSSTHNVPLNKAAAGGSKNANWQMITVKPYVKVEPV